MKNKLQPTRTSFSRNFQCKKAPRWLSKFFHFGTENQADQLKNHPVHIIHFQRIPWPHEIERFWKLSFQSLSNIAGLGRSRISWYQSSMPINQSNLSVYSQSPMNQQTNGCHCSTFGESAGKQLSQRTISAEHILFQEFLPRFWQTCSTCDREP